MLKDLTTVQKAVLVTLVAVIVLSAAAVAFRRGQSLPPDETAPTARAASPAAARPVTVQVTGAVLHPGVYILQNGDRAGEAIEAAGGVTSDADAAGVNFARRLRDGQHLQIPHRRSTPPASPRAPVSTSSTSRPPRPAPPPPSAAPSPVNLNAADAAQLARLPGLSRALAERLVAYRTVHGQFRRLEETLLVKGMTPAILEQARPYLSL